VYTPGSDILSAPAWRPQVAGVEAAIQAASWVETIGLGHPGGPLDENCLDWTPGSAAHPVSPGFRRGLLFKQAAT